MVDKTSEDKQPERIPTISIHSGDKGWKPSSRVSSGEETITEEFPAEEMPEEDEKPRTIKEREEAIEFLEKSTASELAKVEGAFEEMDSLMQEYEKIKGMVTGLTKDHPQLKKYL